MDRTTMMYLNSIPRTPCDHNNYIIEIHFYFIIKPQFFMKHKYIIYFEFIQLGEVRNEFPNL